jgi:hypothetical protein
VVKGARLSRQLYGDGWLLALRQFDPSMLMQSWLLEMHIFSEGAMGASQLLYLYKRTGRALALGMLIILSQCLLVSAVQAKSKLQSQSQPQPKSQSQPAEEAALHFYRWYMQSLAISQDPLLQSPEQMSAYVDRKLMNELKRRMGRKGLHADYFIQAQEYMDDWTTDIKVVRFPVRDNLASVVVILGGTPETRRMLALTLTRADGDWKICMVRLV